MIKHLLIFILSLCSLNFFGQGCSDAGFCTINSFKPNNADSLEAVNNQFKIGEILPNTSHLLTVDAVKLLNIRLHHFFQNNNKF